MKTTVSEKVSFENETFWIQHTEKLKKKLHVLCLAMLEKSDMIWKSYMFNLKKGTLKYLYSTPVWTPCQHKLTFYNGENLHQISVNYVYRQALNCKVEDKKLQTIF